MAIIAQFTTIKPEMAHNRTYEDFSKFMGVAPTRLGLVSSMYEHMTASFITEGVGNIYYNEEKKSKFQSINSLMFEWDINVSFIKRVAFAAVPVGDGANGQEITMAFTERYYEKFDTFVIENTKQQCIVLMAPIRKSDNYWEYTCQLLDSTYRETLQTVAVGDETRFITNYMPEMHEQGYSKFQSNIEKQRNFITEHRVDISMSNRYKAMEDSFIKLTKTDEKGSDERFIRLPAIEKQLLDNFMEVRNNGLLWQKGTMDENGKSTVTDPDTKRPLIAGDGAIPQINRFAGKYAYNKISVAALNKAIVAMTQKSAQITGNTYAFVCNQKLYSELQTTLAEYLNNWKVINAAVYSQKEGKEIAVGATYNAYEFMGNKIIFKPDRALSYEYPNKGYAVLIDLTADKTSGMPAIQMFTIKGQEFISNVVTGVGIQSGNVATAVAGTKYVNSGYAGIGVFNPYRSFVLYEA